MSKMVTILVDGRQLEALAGQSVAAALYAAGIVWLRSSPRAGTARGAFCMMGVCQECVVTVDGARLPGCQVAVKDGMAVELHGNG